MFPVVTPWHDLPMRRAGAPAGVRTPYVIDEDAADRAVVAAACRSIMDVLEGVAVSAYVDCLRELVDLHQPRRRTEPTPRKLLRQRAVPRR